MTPRYEPSDARYFDPGDLREEIDRVFDLCHGCRLCFNLCPSFPHLFDAADAHEGEVSELTDAERDRVVDECYQCKLCYTKCPYTPPHEWALDFPRLMLRVLAVRERAGKTFGDKLTDQFLGRTDVLGRVSVPLSNLVNRTTGTPGSFSRRVFEKTLGIASGRMLPPYARQRFSTWFSKRRAALGGAPSAGEVSGVAASTGSTGVSRTPVSLYPTCFIEYMDPDIGKDIVGVFEHNGVECTLPDGVRCCGAAWLHSGNLEQFERNAKQNVAALAEVVRQGHEVIVAQPTCAYVIREDYPLYLGTEEAELVAAHTSEPGELLLAMHKSGEPALDLEFPGVRAGMVPERVTYHVACHQHAQQVGLRSRDLLKLAGISCDVVQRCSGIDGMWGYRAEHYDSARRIAGLLARDLEAAGNEQMCGDCTLANGAILQETGRKPVHPIQLLARAYGLPEHGGDQPRRSSPAG